MNNHFDVIVLGLGAVGSATLYQLALTGKKILGIDQFSPPHHLGSSHGDTRIIRKALGEGNKYVPLVLRSYDIWNKLEKDTDLKLFIKTGGLILSSKNSTFQLAGQAMTTSFAERTIASARIYNIAHEQLDANSLQKRFPQFRFRGDEIGYYEEDSGVLLAENCITAHLTSAEKHHAVIHTNEKVLSFLPIGSQGVSLITSKDTYTCDKLILCAGPWLPDLLEKKYARLFQPYRQVLYWFAIADKAESFFPPEFPVFIWEFDNKDMYGFPALNGKHGGVKIATEVYTHPTTPQQVNREVTQKEIEDMYKTYIQPRFPHITDNCLKAISCMYTVTPSSDFVIDQHPLFPQITIASPCSGHGFKHSAAIGEVLTQQVIFGKSIINISQFNLTQFTAN